MDNTYSSGIYNLDPSAEVVFSANAASEVDPWAELQRLAASAEAANKVDFSEVQEEDITRWRNLFNYNRSEAEALLEAHRADVNRNRISDDHWDMIRHQFEPAGYDKEAYEHAQTLEDLLKTQSTTIHGFDVNFSRQDGEDLFVFRLGGMLDSAEKVQEIACMDHLPRVVQTFGETGVANLCVVGHEQRVKIQAWLRSRRVGSRFAGI